jgi:YD repeat-containing protein
MATLFEYDVLGRTTKTVEANGATTRMTYGFGSPAGDTTVRLTAQVTDAKGNVRVVYRDVGDKVVAVEERLAGRAPTTRYSYNPLGELTSILDAKANPTSMAYDWLGRRTSLKSPDSGLTEYTFDAAGNLTKKVDANLRAKGKAVTYLYEYNRLTLVQHPFSADVVYEYGARGAPENGAGRLSKVVDESGEETRGYGKLGELTRTTRQVVSFRPGAPRREYTTRFDFDSFGRMLSVAYPDGEVVNYDYDAGGLLASAKGARWGHSQTYLEALQYDEFGQRLFMALGNGVTTAYSYEALTRRLSTLATTLPPHDGVSRKVQNLAYGYDVVGNVTTITNALGGDEF